MSVWTNGKCAISKKFSTNAQPRGFDRNSTADDDAPVGLVRFGDRQQIGRRRSQCAPQIAVALPCRQRRVVVRNGYNDIARCIAGDDEINAEQAVGRAAHCDVLQRLDTVPLVERGLFG
jgi:hypothetical protein